MKHLLYLCCLALVLAGCSKKEETQPSVKKNGVFVSILPQKGIVEAIGGKYFDVKVLVPPGRDPHDYRPTPMQILSVFTTQAYFEIGMPFEGILLDKIKRMGLKTDFVDTCKGIKKHTAYINGRKVVDPHVWLSVSQLHILAGNILDELIKLMPSKEVYFTKNYKEYVNKIDEVKTKLKYKLAPFKGKTFLVFHPAFGYFARDFGLKQLSVEIEGKEPSPKELLSIIKKAKALNIKIVFAEPQFSKKATAALAKAINGTVILINPLAENILKNFQIIADKLKQSFNQKISEN